MTYDHSVLAVQTTGIDGMELLRLLQWVLAGVGVFIVRVGFLMVKSINGNTDAVSSLVKSIDRLIHQHEEQSKAAEHHVAESTRLVMDTITKGFTDVRQQLEGSNGGDLGKE